MMERKVALVTGAARGIGREIALRLVRDGFAVAVHYGRSDEAAATLVNEITASGGEAVSIQGDMRQLADIERVFEFMDRRFGRLDALVNNAGVVRPTPLDALSEEMFEEIIGVNLKGAAFAGKEAARRMALGGRIVNVSSSRAHFPAANTGLYAASKRALEMLTSVWAKELGERGITVNAVAPGPTSPGMFDRVPEAMKARASRSSPFLRIGEAGEIAGVVGFLCSEDARWVSGEVILVNGAGEM